MTERALTNSDLDALFRACKFALRIPDRAAARLDRARWTANEVLNAIPSRKYLYHGERAQACLVATVPSYKQLRHPQTPSTKPTETLEATQGNSAINADEAEHFFSTLKFCVVAYEASAVGGSSSSGQQPDRRPQISPHPLRNEFGDRSGYISTQAHRAANVDGLPAYTVAVGYDKSTMGERYIEYVDDGSWSCIYPFTIDTPVPTHTFEQPAESAISFDIRVACQSVDDALLVSYNDEPIDRAKYNDKSVHLEELATRVASEIFAVDRSSNSQKQHQQVGSSRHSIPISFGSANKALEGKPVLPRRMLQALVSTRSIAEINTRVVELPPNFGSSTVLVEVSVRCEAMVGQEMELQSVDIVSSGWHATRIDAQSALPVFMNSDHCWRSVFSLCPLVKSAKQDALRGLNVLNINGAPRHQQRTGPQSTQVVVEATSPTPADLEPQTFIGTQHLALPARALDMLDSRDGPASLADPSSVSNAALRLHTPMHAGNHFSGIFGGNSPASFEPLSSSRISFSNSIAHMKSVSLDATANSRQAPARKLSLLSPSTAQQLLAPSTTSFSHSRQPQRPVSMLRLPPRYDYLSSHFLSPERHQQPPSPAASRFVLQTPGSRSLNVDQRSRAATINDFSLTSPNSPMAPMPRYSVSTPRNNKDAASKPLQHAPALSDLLESPSSSVHKQQSSALSSAVSTEPQISYNAIGTISMSFEAPPKVGLGEEFLVNVYVSNNTNVHYFRLVLVDISSTNDTEAEEAGYSLSSVGLLSMEHSTELVPLRPGESTCIALRYIAAEPHFHTIKLLRLLNMDADTADKTLATIESPFVVYVDDD
ncbi:hypothetical protein GGI12_002988 [Dipsacomyces acuminosporus]|nr:hypothetical protein GGI12_002988 [Dipsacomyces acuminosporus]